MEAAGEQGVENVREPKIGKVASKLKSLDSKGLYSLNSFAFVWVMINNMVQIHGTCRTRGNK
jgi:hypothetical protein